MSENIHPDTVALVAQDFGLATDEKTYSEEDILALLSEQVAYLIDNRMEYLLSLMYRLDISEARLNWALSPLAPDPPHIGVAKLVLERQKQRVATKHQYRQQAPEDLDEELSL